MTNGTHTCAVDNCDKPTKRAGFCYSHYMKNWRYGTPTPRFPPKWDDIRGQRYGTLTVTKRVTGAWLCQCDCGATRTASAGELNRTGDASTCGIPGQHLNSGYRGIHEFINRTQGPARNHPCVTCGGQARHWSYDHTDPDEHLDYTISKNPVAYSLDPSHYSPRCVPCHKRYDLDRANALATAGAKWHPEA